jgi:pimeloyl-ACP methyl ester carboxylesterase
MPVQVVGDGVTISFDDCGSGRTVVFLHGVMMSRQFFKHQLPYFSKYYRTLAIDFRGHGDSDKTLSGHTVSTYAQDLRALFDKCQVEQPVLVGWSMGAMVIFEYLKSFGQDDIAGIVIVDQPPSDFVWPGYEFGVFTLDWLIHSVEGLQTEQRKLVQGFVNLMLHQPEKSVVDWMVSDIMKVPPAIAVSILVTQTFRDYREFFSSIKVPTMVIFGGDDKLTSPRAGEFIAARIPQARLQIFEQSSHCPFYEEPERFNRVVHEFVSSLGN